MAPIAFNSNINRVDEILVPKRLGQKFDRAGLDGSNGHRNVAMCRDEDNWKVDTLFLQIALEVESVDPREPNIKHNAPGSVGPFEI